MNHKHIQVVIEDLQYVQEITAWDAINDLVDYVECVEKGRADDHYARCIGLANQPKIERKEQDV